MKTEQLSSKDQKRVSDALAKCASATKSIEDPAELQDAAYAIFKESLGDNPGLFKVACRVYNSCKSIHKLASATDDSRGNSFAILDANALTARLKQEATNELYKKASAPVTFGVLTAPEQAPAQLRKAASATAPKIAGIKAEPLSNAAKRSAVVQIISDWESLVKEASAELSAAQHRLANNMAEFSSALLAIPTELRKTAAAEIYANYGSVAGAALERFNSNKPLHKIASSDYVGRFKGTPLITHNELGKAAEKLFESNTDLLVKKAYMDRVAIECTAAIADLFGGMRKAAADGLAGKALTAAIGADVVSGIPELLGYDYTDDKAKSALADTQIENAIIAAGSRRAFMKSLHNDTIASYPLPDVIKAFNMAYSKLPPSVRRMPATRSQALIDAEMIATLAEGNTPSKADREHLLSIMGQFDYKNPVGLSEGLVSR